MVSWRIAPLIAALVTLTGAGGRAVVDPTMVREAIEAAWNETALPGSSLEVRSVPALAYESGRPRVEVVLPDGPLRPGPRALTVACVVDDRTVSRGLASVVVSRRILVWVPRRNLTRGETVTAIDLRPEPRVVERDPVRAFEDPGDLTWIAARDLEAGVELRSADLDRRPDVVAGDAVQLVSRAGDASVAVTGRVRRAANVGESLLVLNPVTGSVVRAVLESPGVAVLEAGEPAPSRSSR
ncbi:MAG: flagellar basal body P-ring formation protein FlgA [Gemmatimonadetes bacterium]|nr:flagellar basal body P-ring formation protein FlgA [Gemmatimonadota bacterium]